MGHLGRSDNGGNLRQGSGSSLAMPCSVSVPLSLGGPPFARSLTPSEFAEGCVLAEGSCSYLHAWTSYSVSLTLRPTLRN